MSGARQYTTFFVDRYHFAIDVEHAQEVVQPMMATPVPLTSDVVTGLVNLRGQIITAVDMRARLDLPPNPGGGPTVSLIVRTASGLISLRADRLGDVLDLETYTEADSESSDTVGEQQLELEPIPDTVSGPVRELVVGVLQLEKSLLLVLDPEQLLTAAVGLSMPDDNE